MSRWIRPLMMAAAAALALGSVRANACEVRPTVTTYAPVAVPPVVQVSYGRPQPIIPPPVVVDDYDAWRRDAQAADYERFYEQRQLVLAQQSLARARARFAARWGWNPRAMAWFDAVNAPTIAKIAEREARYEREERRRDAYARRDHRHHRHEWDRADD